MCMLQAKNSKIMSQRFKSGEICQSSKFWDNSYAGIIIQQV